ELVRPRRRDLDELPHRLGVVRNGEARGGERADRALDLLAEGVAELTPLRAGVDGLDGEVLGRLLVCEDVADGVGGVDGEERDFFALRELQSHGGGARGLADAALAGEEEKSRRRLDGRRRAVPARGRRDAAGPAGED